MNNLGHIFGSALQFHLFLDEVYRHDGFGAAVSAGVVAY